MTNTTDPRASALSSVTGALLGALLLLPLILLLVWNSGVVGIATATGGTVGSIGYFTALGASFGLLLLRGLVCAARA